MKQYYSFLLFACLILSCKSEPQTSAAESKISDRIELTSNVSEMEFEEEYYEVERDSVGYPDYYTHPELRNITELESILKPTSRVMAYNYNRGEENPANMGDDNQYLYHLESGELISNAYNEKELKAYEKKRLIELLSDSTNYSGSWSGLAGVCYIPHVGFGFFEKDSLVAQASVCFMCSGIRTNPFYKSDELSEDGLEKFNSFVKGIGLKTVYR